MSNQTTPDPGNSVIYGLLAAEKAEQATWPREPITAFRALTGDPRNEETPEEKAAREAAEAATQTVDWDSDDNPYKKRFTDTQASYTQNQQRLRELERYENDPQAYYELGAKHGVQFEFEGQQPPEAGALPPEVAQELSELRQWRQGIDQERQDERVAAGEELFHQDLDEWATEAGVELNQADHNAIFGLLMKAPDPTQESVARQIFDAHITAKKTEREALEKEIRESLKRPRVPGNPTVGGNADTGVPNWSEMSRTDVNKHMAEQVLANRGQQ